MQSGRREPPRGTPVASEMTLLIHHKSSTGLPFTSSRGWFKWFRTVMSKW